MTYEEFASDLPLDRTFSFTAVEQMEEELARAGVNQPMRQIGKGKFRAHLAVLETEHGDLFSDRYSKAISLYLEPTEGMVGIVFPRTANGCFSASGDDIGNDKLIVFHEGSGVDIVGPSQVGSDAIAVPQTRFNEMVEVLSPTAERFEKTSIVEGNAEKLHKLRDSIVDLISRPELDPNGEQVSNVIGLSIAWMYDSSGQWSREEPKAFGARTRVARLAQEYIEAHHRERVCVEDLCRISGVGVRTLQRRFQEYFNVTISEYLNAVRLDSARRELAAACPLQESVAMIARRNGCVHPGRFSVGYRQHFGESPSDTLARQAGS